MRRTNGGSRYRVPFSVIPERGKVSENVGKSSSPESPDVFHDDVVGSKFANQTRVLSPEAASLSVKTCTLASQRDVLTREAPADGLDGLNSIGSKPGSGKLSHVVIAGNSRPVLRQHAAAERVDLAEGARLETGALQAQAEPTDAAEQVEEVHATSNCSAICRGSTPTGGTGRRTGVGFGGHTRSGRT
jgi:hypothetical protein